MKVSFMDLLPFAAGVLCLVAAWRDWDWFFDNQRAAWFVDLLGRNGARVAYALLGLALLVLGVVLAGSRPALS